MLRTPSFVASASALALLLLLTPISCGFQWEEEEVIGQMDAKLGGIEDVDGAANSAEVEELARFAVDEHNKKENALLQFSRVVKAKQQVVAGLLHYITVEVIEGGKKKLYEAQVVVQAWLNSKKLHDFKVVGDSAQ